ncbi:MAG: aminotransferase class I/II-fold pyridoxal phosphate-dependent enzyme [Rhizobiales bacterium]|nr:aminotransferase class I/II-fold pyridoxal phosphate-dependent enzyme [Hyphomicrobiales bacterium]
MPRATLPLGTITLDDADPQPLYRQLYDGLRMAILEGRLRPGLQLPSSRHLAAEWSVARNTVIAAYEQLTAEGYLETTRGAGTHVARILPEYLLEVGKPRGATGQRLPAKTLSRRGLALSSLKRGTPGYQGAQARPFQHGLAAIDEFPSLLWSRLLARHARTPGPGTMGYELGQGLPALREAIADYTGAARGTICKPEQVIVTSGAQAALDLAARMLIDPGDRVWLEEPGYLGARGALLGAGADILPVPVDAEGLTLETVIGRSPPPRLIYVTPSHQFPMGCTLSLARRLALLDYAGQQGSLIIEDDYDAEYRFAGRPIASMQGLDRSGSVIYMGTFAKTLFPALRVGYLIVPEAMVEAFSDALRITGMTPPAVMQAALADFITEGHFAAHIRRMRTRYAERRDCLSNAIEADLAPWLRIAPGEGGLQLAAVMAQGADDRALSAAAKAANIHVTPLSTYFIGTPTQTGLHMGYAGIAEPQMKRAARKLATISEALKIPKWI